MDSGQIDFLTSNKEAEVYDQGEYICVAENNVGRIDAAANIVVVPDPYNRRFDFLLFPQ